MCPKKVKTSSPYNLCVAKILIFLHIQRANVSIALLINKIILLSVSIKINSPV